jgi:type VI secretion system secreted protein Hcp
MAIRGIWRTVIGVGVGAALLVGAPAALAKSPGALSVSGQPQTSEILAWSWGMSNSGSAHVGGGVGAGKANIQDVSVTKLLDANSVALAKAVATGQHFEAVTLDFPLATGVSPFVVKLELQEVLVTSYSTGGSAGQSDAMTENVTFNFAKFKYSIGTASFGFNVAENVPLGWDQVENTPE